MNCFYCGERPSNKKIDFNGGRKISDEFVFMSGIDRINPNRGYEVGNVRPCCKICNFGKSDYSEKEFFDKVKGIVNRIKNGLGKS